LIAAIASRSRVRLAGPAVTLLLLTGCSLVGRAAPPAADLSGQFEGVVRLEGDENPSVLHLQQEPSGHITATLETDLGLTAAGQGRLEGTVLRLELEYGSDCPGELELAGQALEGGAGLAGTVEARDCTGSANGSFSFSRR
jgi:hypothetical protein